MNTTFNQLAALAFCLASAPQAFAGAGHDHGPDAPAPGAALPRFSAASDQFELVGVVHGRQLTVYLDRFADNQPVQGARIELELGGAPVALKEREPGEFEGLLSAEPQPGITPVTATVVAGSESDLLAADLDVHAPAEAAEHRHAWTEYLAWSAGALVLGAGGLWGLGRAKAASRARNGGGA